MSKIVVKNKDEENPVPVEIIAESIEKIAKAMQIINNTRLTRRAIITLIHDHSKVSKNEKVCFLARYRASRGVGRDALRRTSNHRKTSNQNRSGAAPG